MNPRKVTCPKCGATAYLVDETPIFGRKEPRAKWECENDHTIFSEELDNPPQGGSAT